MLACRHKILLTSLLVAFGIALLLAPRSAPAAPEAGVKPVDFDRDIRGILSDNCYTCHGPDEKNRQAGLRLDTKDGPQSIFAPRKGYQIVAGGQREQSRLFQKISAVDKNLRMPPPYSNRSLTPAQIALIGRWIDEGAKWETHWAYVPPKRPPVPPVKDASWPRNAIDNFILARLESEGLKPSPEADKVTLLRRVTFDLTGLPPTPAEIDAFLADRSPDAYEKQVDRLLASPRYGERMTMEWLDLARYADTHGYHIDPAREMWHWRDWVIGAFNRNMPFDEFTVEQLAGDLLPHPTRSQLIATGFNRNHMINFEGGAIPEEYQVEYVVDRVETTSITWMGMTLGCARCHDHKYDPIKQKDFYRFYAFFNTIPEKGLDGRKGNAEPLLQLPSPEQEREMNEVKSRIAADEKAMPPEKDLASMQAAWEQTALQKLPEASRRGLLAHYELDGSFADSSGGYHPGRIRFGDLTYSAGPLDRAAEFDAQTEVDLGNQVALDRSKPFSVALWLRSGGTHEMQVLQKIADAEARRGFELTWEESNPIGHLQRGANLSVRLTSHWPDNAIEVRTKRALPISSKERLPRPWYQVTVNYDGSGRASGLRLFVNGGEEPLEVAQDKLSGPIASDAPWTIGSKTLGLAYKGSMDDLRFYNRVLSASEIRQLAAEQPIRATLWLQAAKRAKDQQARLTEYFLTHSAPEPVRKLHAELEQLESREDDLNDAIPTTMIMEEMAKPRETFILRRGDYRNHLDKVTPAVPAVLPPLPKDAPANRLTLARWLVSPTNPLTSRVVVNRYWQMYFGTGIVKTAQDFGSQGDPPSHPELLDWLATEFIRTGWNVKAMQRLIVTSAAYRQASRVTPELLEKDPENRLLARGPRFRLPAEMVRDNALAVSGLLKERVGGPSVFPYQPKGLWRETSYGDVYTAQYYTPSHGDDLYRRSMYTFWKRTVPPPTLLIFDAPDREKCTARRSTTNTPLQALALMNDTTYVEAARALAQRMLLDGGPDAAKRIAYAFRLATDRKPTPEEEKILLDLERKKLADYSAHPGAAAKLIHVGESSYNQKLKPSELAAYTTVASVILNLDETITKE